MYDVPDALRSVSLTYYCLCYADAALEAFYPGTQGAGVIANSLFGVGPDANRLDRQLCAEHGWYAY